MKRRLFPLIAGIFIGTTAGVSAALPTVRLSEWLVHGLYNTAVKSVLHSVNHRVLIACIACYSIWALLAVRTRMKGSIRRIPELGAIAGLLAAIDVRILGRIWSTVSDSASDVLRSLADLSPDLMRDMYASGGPQIIAAGLILAAGLFALGTIRRRSAVRPPSVQQEQNAAKPPATGKRLVAANRLASLIARGNWGLYAVVLLPFAGMNLASLGFDTANGFALRNRPNVILIQIDTLRADHLGCYGYRKGTSPNIDKLAGEGTRFEKAIAPAPWTTPSVAQYMTGRYLKAINFEFKFSGMPVNAVSIAEALKDRGYRTVGVNSNLLAGSARGFARGFDSYDESVYEEISSPYVYSTAVKRLKALKGRKFFMFLLFMDVHSPYTLHEEHNFYPDYKGRLGKRVQVRVGDRTDRISKDDLEYMNALYDSEIAYTDEYVGRLMDELKRLDLYRNTLVIILSDHGEEFGEHGQLEHGKNLYDETLSVPMIMKLPGQQKAGTVRGVFPLLDLFPTAMGLLGFGTSSLRLDGTAGRLDGSRDADARPIYSSTEFPGVSQSCIRTGSYKLIADRQSQKQELYWLKRDPGEERNVIESTPSVARDLYERLKRLDQVIETTAPSGALSNADPIDDNSAHLKSLGYL